MIKVKKEWQNSLLAAVVMMIAVLGVQPLQAATVYVGTCVANVTTFSTIQAAVNDSRATDIKVCPGNYPEQVTINRNLTLTGINSATAYNPTVIVPIAGFVANTESLTNGSPIAAQILVQYPATDVTISYLAVDGSGSNLNSGCSEPPLIGVYYEGASGTVNYVATRNQAQNAENFGCASSAALGMFVESGDGHNATVTIKNSTIHGYQKNGITADETGTTVTLNSNTIVGAGLVNAAQNGIQVAFGATGTVENNTISDDDSTEPSNGIGAGILVYGSGSLTISGNTVANTQTGIVTVTAGGMNANETSVTNNQVSVTHLGDGIDLCSNGNTATNNTVFSSDEAGIHLDATCGSTGRNNMVSKNVINEACAAFLEGGTGNTISSNNTLANVANTTLAGDQCPVAAPSVENNREFRSDVNSANSHPHTYVPARP